MTNAERDNLEKLRNNLEGMVEQINCLLEGQAPKEAKVKQLSKEEKKKEISRVTAKHIIEIGIPAHLKGFVYVQDAINFAIMDPDIMSSMENMLYPKIAKKNQTTASRVERDIRHAIEVAFVRGNIKKFQTIFGHTVVAAKKPTNSVFIAMLAFQIRRELDF